VTTPIAVGVCAVSLRVPELPRTLFGFVRPRKMGVIQE
jgi:hypothetical protein